MTVVCSDDGRPAPLTSHKSLTIYVTDANDNTPVFTSQVSVYTTFDDVSSRSFDAASVTLLDTNS